MVGRGGSRGRGTGRGASVTDKGQESLNGHNL